MTMNDIVISFLGILSVGFIVYLITQAILKIRENDRITREIKEGKRGYFYHVVSYKKKGVNKEKIEAQIFKTKKESERFIEDLKKKGGYEDLQHSVSCLSEPSFFGGFAYDRTREHANKDIRVPLFIPEPSKIGNIEIVREEKKPWKDE